MLPADAARPATRVAVKRFTDADTPSILEEEAMLRKMSGRPTAIAYHGLFWDSEPVASSSSSTELSAIEPCANLLMG